MKLLYVTTHQISNLLPLFRELSKKKKISFKVIFWQNLSSTYYDKDFKKIIDYGLDTNSGYDKYFLCNKKRDKINMSIFFKLKTFIKLIRFLHKEEYDEIVFHSSYTFIHILASIFSKLTGKKTIVRSMSYNLGKRSKIKKFIRLCYYSLGNLFFDKFWSMHKLNTEFFTDFGVNKEKINLIHHSQGEFIELVKKDNNLLLNVNDFCDKYQLPKNKKFILFAGLFIERKNPKLLLQSFIDAKLSNDWFLLMVGGGKFEEEMKSLVYSNKINNVKFLGFRNQKELIGFFANSEMLVVPSNAGDSHCNVAAEAIQFGCAIIGSNMIGLYPEFIDEKVGLIFDINKKEQLTDHLKSLTSNSSLLIECQKNALEYGKKKTPQYSSDQIVENLIA